MSGIFYKNRPYAGGGGGTGGASALSDLTDTSISSPTNGQVLKYNNGFWENDDESGGTTVVANPQGAASADLEKLQVGNNIYGIPQGTEVVANPTGTASTQLNKLQVGNDIYSIPSGGGSGGITKTQLFAQSPGQHPDTITLSDDYANYDYLEFHQYKYDDNSYYDMLEVATITKEQLDSVRNGFVSGRTNVFLLYGWQSGNQFVRYQVTDGVTFTRKARNGNWGLIKIYGIKYQ